MTSTRKEGRRYLDQSTTSFRGGKRQKDHMIICSAWAKLVACASGECEEIAIFAGVRKGQPRQAVPSVRAMILLKSHIVYSALHPIHLDKPESTMFNAGTLLRRLEGSHQSNSLLHQHQMIGLSEELEVLEGRGKVLNAGANCGVCAPPRILEPF